MRTLFIIAIGIGILTGCGLPQPIAEKDPEISIEASEWNRQNYREYSEQEIKYYRYVLKNNGERFERTRSYTSDGLRKGSGEPVEKYSSEAVNHKKELIQTLENKGLKPCRFVEKVLKKGVCGDTLDKTTEIGEDPAEESKSKKSLFKNKEYRHWFWQGVFKIISSLYFIFLAITNFQLFTMIFPTSICLLACICYPIWWKRGYLENPYAKIATFIAAYGGLFANILWIILYI